MQTEDRITRVGLDNRDLVYDTLTDETGKLEDAVVDLERKRLNKENERNAAKAMESLNVTSTTQFKDGDVEMIVSFLTLTIPGPS